MLIKQLSVFMENKAGRLANLTKALRDNNIDLISLSVADTQDFGIVRLISRDNDKAYNVLKEAGFSLGITEMIGVEVENRTGALFEILKIFENNNISIEYLYSFLQTASSAKILFKVEKVKDALSVLKANNIKPLTEKDF